MAVVRVPLPVRPVRPRAPLASEVNYSVSSMFEWAAERERERLPCRRRMQRHSVLSYDPIIRLRSDGGKFFVYLFDDALRGASERASIGGEINERHAPPILSCVPPRHYLAGNRVSRTFICPYEMHASLPQRSD